MSDINAVEHKELMAGLCASIQDKAFENASTYQWGVMKGMPNTTRKLIEIAIAEWRPEYTQMPLEAVKSDLEDRMNNSKYKAVLGGIVLGVFIPVLLPLIVVAICSYWIIDAFRNGEKLNKVCGTPVDFTGFKGD